MPGQEDIGKIPEGKHIMKEMILMPWRQFSQTTAGVSSDVDCKDQWPIKVKRAEAESKQHMQVSSEGKQRSGTGSQGDPGRAARLGKQHELWTSTRRGLGRRKARGGRRHGPRVGPDCDMKH